MNNLKIKENLQSILSMEIFNSETVLGKGAIAIISGLGAFFFGVLDTTLKVLIAFLILDYITGVLVAIKSKSLSSEIGFWGIVKKLITLIIVAASYLIQNATGGNMPLREITIMFFIANEGLSMLENAAAFGIPLPDKLKKALLQLRDDQ